MSDQDLIVQNDSSSSGPENPLQFTELDEKFLLEESILIIKTFNRLFADVAPISNNFIGKNSDKSVEISQKQLTDSQKQVILELSGHILTMTSPLFERKLYDFHIHNQFASDVIPVKFREMEKSIDTVHSLQKQAFLLKDYLLREVRCNAELEDKVRNLEEEIVELNANHYSGKTVGRKRLAKSQELEDDEGSKNAEGDSKVHPDVLMERVPSIESHNAQTSPELSGEEEVQVVSTKKAATPKRETNQKQKKGKSEGRSGSKNPRKKIKDAHIKYEFPDEPTKFIGQFVRKMFGDSYYFGLIANYDEEWWNIVYEDADSEDMVWEEITTTYWTSLVPREKKERCFRHARNLGTLHDSLISDGVNSKFLQGPAPSLKNKASKVVSDNVSADQSKENRSYRLT
mmetsp:Transcript_11940/g.12869  ORF Transcript_11940/g.12869 Transcript_11940/m.12869 type:complete len:401 (+) Transcript_11940:61-1263(+)